jgi:hypothetical protein
MLCMHIVIADHLLSDFLCRVKLAGHTPTIIGAHELGVGDSHVVIGLARMNEITARTLVAWLRNDSGAKSVALNWHPKTAKAANEQLGLTGQLLKGSLAENVDAAANEKSRPVHSERHTVP